jgi:hypothetical protein
MLESYSPPGSPDTPHQVSVETQSGPKQRSVARHHDTILIDGGDQTDGLRIPEIKAAGECSREKHAPQIGGCNAGFGEDCPDPDLDGRLGLLDLPDVSLAEADAGW